MMILRHSRPTQKKRRKETKKKTKRVDVDADFPGSAHSGGRGHALRRSVAVERFPPAVLVVTSRANSSWESLFWIPCAE